LFSFSRFRWNGKSDVPLASSNPSFSDSPSGQVTGQAQTGDQYVWTGQPTTTTNTTTRAAYRWGRQDRQGSVIAVSDAAGVVTPYAYGEGYGEPQSWAGSRLRYTGQMAIPEAQLYHYRARAYDPLKGRFLQTDPIGYGDGPNVYAYVHGDPVNGTDPSGTSSPRQMLSDNDLRVQSAWARGGAAYEANCAQEWGDVVTECGNGGAAEFDLNDGLFALDAIQKSRAGWTEGGVRGGVNWNAVYGGGSAGVAAQTALVDPSGQLDCVSGGCVQELVFTAGRPATTSAFVIQVAGMSACTKAQAICMADWASRGPQSGSQLDAANDNHGRPQQCLQAGLQCHLVNGAVQSGVSDAAVLWLLDGSKGHTGFPDGACVLHERGKLE
jgi:RHS repeat-associated protein